MNSKNTYFEKSLYCALYFFYYWSIGTYNAFIYLYFKNIGFNSQQIGLIAGVIPFIAIISQFFWGLIADKINKKNLLIFLLNFIVALFTLFYLLTTNFNLILFITIIFFFFNSAIGPLTDSATLSFLEVDSHSFGKYRLWGSLSFCFATYITGILSEKFNLSVIFYEYSLAIFILAFLSLKIKIKKIITSIDFHFEEYSINLSSLLSQITELLFTKKLILFWLGNLFLFITINANFVRYSLLWSDLGGNNSLMGLSWTIGAIFEIPLFFISYKFLNYKNSIFILAFSAFIASIRWFIFYSASSYWTLLFFQPLHSVIFALSTAAGIYYINYIASEKIKYSAQSLLNIINYGIAAIIGNMLAGFTYSTANSGAIYFPLTILSLIATFLFLFIK
ncbi:MAG TPA: MFS transporter [bacterium]|nr:MFS transporter [bacterium]HOL48837.1 MFS transporter [bacterium]HPQ19899.1 MFS transporter [bacterium]